MEQDLLVTNRKYIWVRWNNIWYCRTQYARPEKKWVLVLDPRDHHSDIYIQPMSHEWLIKLIELKLQGKLP